MTPAPESAALREKVARAICVSDGLNPDAPASKRAPGEPEYLAEPCAMWEHHVDAADAAIAAMSEHDAARGWQPLDSAPLRVPLLLWYAEAERMLTGHVQALPNGHRFALPDATMLGFGDPLWKSCPLPPPPAPPSAPSIAPEEGNGNG